MSRTYHDGDRRIRVKGIRRPTDLRRLARTLIELEQARAEAESEAEHRQRAKRNSPGKRDKHNKKAKPDWEADT
jgi:hypothetical protein